MKYMAPFERKALEKGRLQGVEEGLERGIERGMKRGRQEGELHALKEGILDILKDRFENVPERIIRKIMQEQDMFLLKHLLRLTATVNSLEEFEEKLSSEQ